MAGLASVLNPDGVRFVEIVDDLGLDRLETRYTIMDDKEYKELLERDLSEAMRVYWTETLGRAHLASATAILRSRRWLSGVEQASAQNNLVLFAAALRGLMESAADASTALIGTPLTLAHRHAAITESLEGRATSVLISSEVEDELIHYSHARGLKGTERANEPATHKARQVQEYLTIFGDQNADSIKQCYGDLCDLTHPGASSVTMWLDTDDPTGSEFRLSTRQDQTLIADLLNRYPTMTLELLMFAFNGPVIALNVLNYFPIEDLHTPKLLNWQLDGVPAWTKCRNELEREGARPRASAP